MYAAYRVSLGAAILLLAGCGTYVPEIEEFWGSHKDATFMVNKIAGQVVCELRGAVQQVVQDNQFNPPEFVPGPGDPPPPKPRDLN